jgi:putative nucleotidyltransferase with HDIG domain
MPYTVGRDRENKLHIRSAAVSRFHAVLFAENGEHFVQDMESTNGTFLNGRRVKRSKIQPGDKVTIANVDIAIETPKSPLDCENAPLDVTVSVDRPARVEQTVVIKDPTRELLRDDATPSEDPDKPSKSHRALQVLYRADKVLTDIADFRQLLEDFMDLIMEVIPASRGYIFLLNRDTDTPVAYVRRAPDPVSSDTEIVVSKTILQAAVQQRESLISNDALVDERFAHSRSVASANVRSAICAPLLNRTKVLGVIYLDSTGQSCLFTKDDLSLLSAMALKAGIALDNARLYDDMRNLFFNTVETLVRAIQARDQYTSGHSSRVSRYCLLTAEKLNLSTQDKHHLYLTAMLHDIGKIGIPDNLLNRRGKLSDEEMQKVREHVSLGASMLKSLGQMHPIVPYIRHHHEAYDGSGYPDGLKGEQIPLISRIVAVADTFDAMTSDRPYRKGRSATDAIAELERCAGTTFDPVVVNAFVECLHEQAAREKETAPAAESEVLTEG